MDKIQEQIKKRNIELDNSPDYVTGENARMAEFIDDLQQLQSLLQEADIDAIQNEVESVYFEITNGRISKWNTSSADVIAEYNDVLNKLVDEEVTERLENMRNLTQKTTVPKQE